MTQPVFEPYRMKTIEPLPQTSLEDRECFLREAKYNPFKLKARQITIDLLTDSGTGAMSAAQWAAIMLGDETYAGSESYFELESVVQDLTGVKHVIPTHQGRSAEHILFASLNVEGKTILANAHFDTTRANIQYLKGQPVDLVVEEASDPENEYPFKGNIDLTKLEDALKRLGDQVAAVLMTVTNNSGGGQPVSLENLRQVSVLARRYGKPFVLDAARFAENAWFIKQREPGQQNRSAKAIAQEMFRLADAFTMSAKKDGLVNIGGLLGVNDDELAQQAKNLLVLIEGFPTYGGLAGRDLAALSVGLCEVLDEAYLAYRISSIESLHRMLRETGIPLMNPAGGHAVYLDARRFYPHIPSQEFPGLVLSNALYLEAGIRTVEIGTLMFGQPGIDGVDTIAPLELVRLAIPRRTYTQSHMVYIANAVQAVYEKRTLATGYRIAWQAPVLRAFTAELEPVGRPLPVWQ